MKSFELKTDDELVNLYSKGCNEAFNTLLKRYDHSIHAYIRLNINDEDIAEDIFQEAFIKVINTIRSGKYRAESKFKNWLMRIVHNLVMDHYRAQAKSNIDTNISDNLEEGNKLSNIASYELNSEELMIEFDTINNLYQKMDLLPKEQKEVIYLKFWEGLSFKEIAEHTGVSINTALGRMRYALKNLRTHIV